MNLMMLLEMAAAGCGDRVAIQSGDERLTYDELFAATGAAAGEVQASGCEHMAVLDISSLAVPVSLFASARAGVPFVPLNYRLTGDELDALIERIKPAYMVTDPERVSALEGTTGSAVHGRADFLGRVREGDAAPDWPMDPDDIAILLFTSGTTGVPKAAVLRQKHLVSYILSSVEFAGAGEDEATLVSVPPYHIAGMAAILSSVYAGRRIVQLPNFNAEEWLDLARNEGITHAFVVPTMLSRIVDLLEAGGDVPPLRAIAYGGGKMPFPVIERAMRLFPETAFTNAYGLTETSSTITLLGPDDHRAALASDDDAVRRRLTSLGRALPGVEIEIRDEEGKPVGPGEWGEIYVRGEQVSGEYLGRDSSLEGGGWFPTRDGGTMDSEGYIFLEGRIDDVIVRGGENLSPGEIEDCLLGHASVADVAVFAVPDEQWGEAVGAAVVLKPGHETSEQDLKDWVKGQLRSNRTPSVIVFRPELPYTETGKLLRRQIRAELAEDAS